MKERIKAQLRKSTLALSAAYVIDDALWALRLAVGLRTTQSGATHARTSPKASVDYIVSVFEDYKRYGGVDSFRGDVAELGPGDSAGLALLVRGDGARSVELVDRYVSWRDPVHQQHIYDELARRRPAARMWTGSRCDDEVLPGITWNAGRSAESYFAGAVAEGKRYDFILSRSVLEHLYDPLECLRLMALALRPGGKMIHKVDFRDHGMFEGRHPLTFLEIPEFAYRRMTRYSGRPNRVLYAAYRSALERLQAQGLIQFDLLVTQLAGAGEVLPHRPFKELSPGQLRQATAAVESQRHRFAREFMGAPAEEIAVQGVFIVATRTTTS